ncbi:MAG: hypothetical protein O2789_06760, partial [Actinomycetota bacterium]|nr:hypothetical protein [Actinomycetota bacterium]
MANAFVCRDTDRKLAKEIAKTITVKSYRRQLLRKYDHSGLRILRWIQEKLGEVGPYANAAVAQKMHKLEQAGPDARTVESFNRWKEMWDSWNESQSTDAVLSEGLVAARYEAAVRKLGEPIAERVTAEIRYTHARGDVDLTVDAIHTVLSDYEAQLMAMGDV